MHLIHRTFIVIITKRGNMAGEVQEFEKNIW